jgi:hypothetical protein
MNSTDLEQSIIKARWIRIPTGLQIPAGAILRFRGVARLDRVPVGATISVAASVPYKLYVNGVYEGRGPVPAGPDCVYSDQYDLSTKLKRGANVIGIEMQSGSIPAVVYAKVNASTRAGDMDYATDESWVCSVADDYEVSTYSNGLCETYNDSGKPGEWLGARFGARGWPAVEIAPGLESVDIKDRPVPPASIAQIPPAFAQAFNVPERPKDADIAESFQQVLKGDVTLLKAGSVVGLEAITDPDEKKVIKTPRGDRGVAVILDFDKLISGKLGVNFESAGSGVADIFFATSQPDDGGVPLPDTSLGMMRVNFRKGDMDIRSLVSRQARFIQIEFRRCSKPVMLKTVDIEVGSFASDKNTHFECNRGTLTGLWEHCAERATSLLGSIIGVNDTAFTLDATSFTAISRAAFSLYGDTGVSSYLLDTIETWCKDPLDVPSILLAHAELTGDNSRVCDLYKVLDLHIEKSWSMRNADGLVEISGKVTTLANLKLCRALEAMSAAAWLCGREDDAYAHRDKAVILRKAVIGRLFDERKGLFCIGLDGWHKIREYSTDVNIEAACAGVLNQYERSRIFHWLARPELETALRPDQAASLAMQLIADKQLDGAMEIIGSTLGSPKGTGSDYDVLACAGLFAVVGGVIGVKRVLGVAGRYSVSPVRLGLKQADSSVVIPEGEILVGWRGTRNGTLMQIDVPENVRVDVYIGDDFGNSFRLNGRTLVNGCVTLSAGSHRIHCSDFSARRPAPDKSLLPEVPWASVEVLDGVSQYGVRQRLGRGGDRRRRKEDEPVTAAIDGVEVAEVVEAVEPAAVKPEDKSKRRRRNPRGRKPEEAPVQPVAEVAELVPIDNGELTIDNEVLSPEAAAEVKSKRRRRTRRRKPAEAVDGAAVVETEIAPDAELVEEQDETTIEASEVVETPAEAAAESRSKRRRRSRSKRKTAELVADGLIDFGATPDEEPAEVDIVPVEPAVVDGGELALEEAGLSPEAVGETRSRRRRRSRSRRKPVEAEGGLIIDNEQLTVDNAPEETVEVESESLAVEGAEVPVGETRSRRRRRSRSRHKHAVEAIDNGEAVSDSGELEVESVEVEAAGEELPVDDASMHEEVPVEVPHKRRRRSRSRRKPVEAVIDDDELSMEEPLAIDNGQLIVDNDAAEEVVEEKPKRRRNTRRKKPVEVAGDLTVADMDYDPFAEPVVVAPVVEDPPVVVEEAKPKLRKRAPRKKPESVVEEIVAPVVAEAVEPVVVETSDETVVEVKKPRRRRSPAKPKKPVEGEEVLPEATGDVE